MVPMFVWFRQKQGLVRLRLLELFNMTFGFAHSKFGASDPLGGGDLTPFQQPALKNAAGPSDLSSQVSCLDADIYTRTVFSVLVMVSVRAWFIHYIRTVGVLVWDLSTLAHTFEFLYRLRQIQVCSVPFLDSSLCLLSPLEA